MDVPRNVAATGRELPSQPGFFVLKSEQPAKSALKSGQVRQQVYLRPHDPADLCPCGSGDSFDTCCRMFGPGRVFVADTSGHFAPAVAHREEWTGLSFSEVRSALMNSQDWWCTENSLTRCFWHYCPRGRADRKLFGTVELTPSALTLETLSKPRYQELRAALSALVGPLPSRRRQVQMLSPEATGADTPGGQPEAGAETDEPILGQYGILRSRLRELHSAAVKELLRDEIGTAAKDLGMLGPGQALVFDSELETHLMMDYALYEVRRHGRPVIHHFMRKTPPPDSAGALLYGAMEANRFGIFTVEQVTPEWLLVRDRMDPNEERLRLVDYGLMQSAVPGLTLVGRVLRTPRFCMLGGPRSGASDRGALCDLCTSCVGAA